MPRSKKFRRFRLLLILLVVVVLAGAGVGGWLGVRTVRSSFPQTTGSLHLDGLTSPVQVERDANGIPQIYADSSHDLFMAQGYVQAQDRFWQMDVDRHITSGTLASMFGKSQVDSDAFIQTMNWRGVAQQEYDTKLSASTKAYLQAFSDGVNAWLSEHPGGAGASLEYALLGTVHGGYKPAKWTPVDSVSWLEAMAWDLSGNMQQEVDRSLLSGSLSAQQIAQLYPSYDYAANGTILTTGTVSGGSYHPAGQPASTSTSGTGGTAPGTDGGTTGGTGGTSDGTGGTSTGGTGGANGGATDASYGTTADGPVDGAEQAAELLQANLNSVPDMLGQPGSNSIGSNSWVVAGEHTTTGKPLLADDPHLAAQLPSVWYQMGLHCNTVGTACPFDVTGFTFPGMPGVVIGHNGTVSWGFTNTGADVQDLYLEQVTGPDTYLYDGKNTPFKTRQVTIEVAGGADQTITVRSTQDGMPIISDHSPEQQTVGKDAPVTGSAPPRGSGYAIALRWTALDPNNTMDAVFELDQASNFKQFRKAAQDFAVPAQDMVYADTSGNIGFQMPGELPIRAKGDDGTYPMPGWTAKYAWTGFVKNAELPWAENPDSGYIVAANQPVVGPSYPYTITEDWDYGTRADQITSLIKSKLADGGKISPEDMLSIQQDDTSVMAQTLVPYLLKVKLTDSYYTDAQALLKDWNDQQDAASGAAAYYNAVWSNLLHLVFDQKFPAEVRATDDCIMAVPEGQADVPADDVNGKPKREKICGQRDQTEAQPDGGDRWDAVVTQLLKDPNSAWWSWTDDEGDVHKGMQSVLAQAMVDARKQLTSLMGKDISGWSWGRIHKLELKEPTLGSSVSWWLDGPARHLLNRGPVQLSGGTSAVDATGWNAASGYGVTQVPSMRMVVDLSDLDASRWILVGGASGHAYDAHYDDQTSLWADGSTLAWPFSRKQVDAKTEDRLSLTP